MKVIQLGDEAAKAAEREAGKRFRRVIVPDKAMRGKGLNVQRRLLHMAPFVSPELALMLARGEIELEE